MVEVIIFGTSIIRGVSAGLIPGTGTTIRTLGGVGQVAGGDTQLSVAPTIEIGDGPTIRSIVKILSIDKATEQLSDLAVIYINTVDPRRVTRHAE